MNKALLLLLLTAIVLIPLVGRLPAALLRQEPAPATPTVTYDLRSDPHWDTLVLDNDRPTKLLEVPAGRRFVLTDLWTTMHEEFRQQQPSPRDRMWLELVSDRRRQVVFDVLLEELPHQYLPSANGAGATVQAAYESFRPLPLRWETGVMFGPGQEMWLNYRFAAQEGVRKPNWSRRVHFTGYFEPADAER